MAASINLTPAQRALRSSIAAHTSWANTSDRAARTAPARQAMNARFEDMVDPERVLPAEERERRVRSVKRAHFRALALRSARSRARGQVS